jgi:hypothetical protein
MINGAIAEENSKLQVSVMLSLVVQMFTHYYLHIAVFFIIDLNM